MITAVTAGLCTSALVVDNLWKILSLEISVLQRHERAKCHLVELSIFPSYCCVAHQSVKSNNRKGGNNGNDQKGDREYFCPAVIR